MTTAGIHSKTPPASDAFILPDAPLSQDEKMTNARHLSETGQHHHLVQYLGSPETTIVSSERYVVTQRTTASKLTIPALQCYIPSAKHIGVIVLASFSQWRGRVSNAAQQGAFPAILQIASWRHLPITSRAGVILCPRRYAPRLRSAKSPAFGKP